jgi:hypothetical protein
LLLWAFRRNDKEILNKELTTIETKNWTRESFVAVDDNTNNTVLIFQELQLRMLKKKLLKLLKVRLKFIVVEVNEGLPVDFLSRDCMK